MEPLEFLSQENGGGKKFLLELHMENTGELHGTKSQEHFTSPVDAMDARTLWSEL